MVIVQFYTKKYKHINTFTFQNQEYRNQSIVTLTEEGKNYLKSKKNNAILTEHFITPKGKEWWTYEIGWSMASKKPLSVSTDKPPDELLEEVKIIATTAYAERATLGVNTQSYKKGRVIKKKDWEIKEVRNGWIVFILLFIAVGIFKDWYIELLLRIIIGWRFGAYRQLYINAHTVYIHDEDQEILREKYKVWYY